MRLIDRAAVRVELTPGRSRSPRGFFIDRGRDRHRAHRRCGGDAGGRLCARALRRAAPGRGAPEVAPALNAPGPNRNRNRNKEGAVLPQLKTIVAVNAVSKTNGATASGIVDTLGFDWATIDVIAATADVVSNKPSVLKLQESDDTNATNFADIAAFVGGTAFTIPNANTAATAVLQNNYKFNVDCRTRKRYLQAVYSPQTTQVVTVVANLGRGEQAPSTAAKANAMTLAEG
jgi:hypothetical protein